MKLYGYRNGRTLRALWALEEAGAQYEYVEIDVMRGAGREPWFLEINPGGKVPVLDDDGRIITESAAICIHVADKFPKSQLMPPAGTPERTECYKWISFVLTELDAPLWTIAKHRFGLPKERRVPAVIETAGWEFENAAKIVSAVVEQSSYLTDSFSVADILAAHTVLWAKAARLSVSDALESYLTNLQKRETFARAQDCATTAKPSSSRVGQLLTPGA